MVAAPFSREQLDQIIGTDISSLSLEELVELRNRLFNNRQQLSGNAPALHFWGRVEKRLGQPAAAADCFRAALTADPDHRESIRELGYLAAEQGQIDEALTHFRTLAEQDPADWAAWNDGGCVLRAAGNTGEALAWMQRAIETAPDNATLHANTALLCYELYDYDRAQQFLDAAFAVNPDCAEALHTQAMLLAAQGEHQRSLAFEERALAVKPEYPQAKLGLGLQQLMLGDLQNGFIGYEHRWNGSDKSDTKIMITLNKPHWYGQPVYPQSTLAIMPEQGFGDMVQFAQLVPLLLDRFHRVYWFVPVEMYRLVHHSVTDQRIVVQHNLAAVNHRLIDYEVPIMSLGMALGITLETIPTQTCYLKPDDTALAKFSSRLRAIKGMKVGIAWTGKATLGKHQMRTVDPALLGVLDHPDISFFCLQKFEQPGAYQNPPLTVWFDFMPECADFMDTAGLIQQLDLVISVDTVIAHLAGALGKPVWLLNRLGSEWRWMDNRQESPWYPTMRIFNQKTLGDWRPVLAEVAEELQQEKGRT